MSRRACERFDLRPRRVASCACSVEVPQATRVGGVPAGATSDERPPAPRRKLRPQPHGQSLASSPDPRGLERETGFEPATSSLEGGAPPTELLPPEPPTFSRTFEAGDSSRTRYRTLRPRRGSEPMLARPIIRVTADRFDQDPDGRSPSHMMRSAQGSPSMVGRGAIKDACSSAPYLPLPGQVAGSATRHPVAMMSPLCSDPVAVGAHDIAFLGFLDDHVYGPEHRPAGRQAECLVRAFAMVEVHLVRGEHVAALGTRSCPQFAEELDCGSLPRPHAGPLE